MSNSGNHMWTGVYFPQAQAEGPIDFGISWAVSNNTVLVTLYLNGIARDQHILSAEVSASHKFAMSSDTWSVSGKISLTNKQDIDQINYSLTYEIHFEWSSSLGNLTLKDTGVLSVWSTKLPVGSHK